MDVISEPATEELVDFEVHFLNGDSLTLTLRPDSAETIEVLPDMLLVTYRTPDGAVRELVELYKENLTYTSKRSRTAVILDPKHQPIQQRLAELAAAEDAKKVSRSPATPA